MSKTNARVRRRGRRKAHVRKHVHGTAERPRLTVYRSNTHMYAQVIDDDRGHTLAAASTLTVKDAEGKKADRAKAVGLQIATLAQAAGVARVVFDRNGFKYHGRVAALASGAREAGLEF